MYFSNSYIFANIFALLFLNFTKLLNLKLKFQYLFQIFILTDPFKGPVSKGASLKNT